MPARYGQAIVYGPGGEAYTDFSRTKRYPQYDRVPPAVGSIPFDASAAGQPMPIPQAVQPPRSASPLAAQQNVSMGGGIGAAPAGGAPVGAGPLGFGGFGGGFANPGTGGRSGGLGGLGGFGLAGLLGGQMGPSGQAFGLASSLAGMAAPFGALSPGLALIGLALANAQQGDDTFGGMPSAAAAMRGSPASISAALGPGALGGSGGMGGFGGGFGGSGMAGPGGTAPL